MALEYYNASNLDCLVLFFMGEVELKWEKAYSFQNTDVEKHRGSSMHEVIRNMMCLLGVINLQV